MWTAENRRFALFFSVFVLASSASACAESHERMDPAIEEFGREWARAYCAATARCAFTDSRADEGCVDDAWMQFSELWYERARSGLKDGTVLFRADLAWACVEALDGWSCYDEDVRFNAWSESLRWCDEAFEGIVPDGGACQSSAECQSGVCSGCRGTCLSRPREGESCHSLPCDTGLVCSSGRCVRYLREGEPCHTESPIGCGRGLLCEVERGSAGVCRRPTGPLLAGLGEECAIPPRRCEEGLHCVEVGSRLECRAGGADRDGACVFAEPDLCPAGQHCQLEEDGLGTCVDAPGVGERCSGALACHSGLYCDTSGASLDGSGVCRERGHVGSPCISWEGCYSYHCVGSVCVAPAC